MRLDLTDPAVWLATVVPVCAIAGLTVLLRILALLRLANAKLERLQRSFDGTGIRTNSVEGDRS